MGDTQTGQDETRDRRIGQIIDGYLDRKARGKAEPEGELLAQHPDLADELRSHLELIRHLRPGQSTLEGLMAQGIIEPCSDPGYPARLGVYKISEFVGSGGMGVVLKAYEGSLNRSVALKILRPELAEDQAALARFKREAQAAAALRHPNIVTVYAVGHERRAHYLAMEFIEGPTLADLIRKEWPSSSEAGPAGARILSRSPSLSGPRRPPLPTQLIRNLFRQLLSGLAAAHQAGLVHRDIKSSNILLDCGLRDADCGLGAAEGGLESAIVKIADFGLARMLSARTQMTMPGSVLGTPEYMSPEQARGDSEIDHRTDLYSAGVVLYEMLTGRTPFAAETPSAVIHRILHEEPPDPRTISRTADPHLTSLALRLMAKRPEDRFDTASDVVAALAGPRPVVSRSRRRRLRHRVLAGALLIILLIGAALLFNAVWPRGRLAGRRISLALPDPPSLIAVAAQLDRDSQYELYVAASDAWALKNVTEDTAVYPGSIALSPSGTRLAFTVNSLSEGLRIVDCDGKGSRALAVGPGSYVRWYDEDTVLYVTALDAYHNELLRVDDAGENAVTVLSTPFMGQDEWETFDYRTGCGEIVLAAQPSRLAERADIYVVDPDGEGGSLFYGDADDRLLDEQPLWSHDCEDIIWAHAMEPFADEREHKPPMAIVRKRRWSDLPKTEYDEIIRPANEDGIEMVSLLGVAPDSSAFVFAGRPLKGAQDVVGGSNLYVWNRATGATTVLLEAASVSGFDWSWVDPRGRAPREGPSGGSL